jgi:UPF0271 protein
MLSADINCDMGESTHVHAYDPEKDFALLNHVSSVNLACGFHAGDAHTMHRLVEAALEKNIFVGAHPGFADRENFGRKEMYLPPAQVYDLVLYQLGALDAFLKVHGTRLHHVKPHGALYNMAAADAALSEAICKAASDFDNKLILYAPVFSELATAAGRYGLAVACEVFADRTYQDNGSLVSRSSANAFVHDEQAAIAQVLQMVRFGTVCTAGGKTIAMKADTICIHGDGPNALGFARAIQVAFEREGIRLGMAVGSDGR